MLKRNTQVLQGSEQSEAKRTEEQAENKPSHSIHDKQ
jgi:hypothetical protein